MSGGSGREPFLSAVMPVYNAQRYLAAALESVLAQTFRDFELIVVDDASQDGSLEICEEFARRDERVRLLALEENGGAGNARNIGAARARGTYLTFLDADDALEPSIYQKAAGAAQEYAPDAVKFGLWEEYYAGAYIAYRKKITAAPEVLGSAEEVRRRIVDWEALPLFGYQWNTLYRRELLEAIGLQSSNEPMLEDFRYNLTFFSAARSAVMLGEAGYHYAKRGEDSLSSRHVEDYFPLHEGKVRMLLEKYGEWGLLDAVTERKIFWMYTRIVYSHLCRTMAAHGRGAAQEALLEVRASDLFRRFAAMDFCGASRKERALADLLRSDRSDAVLWACRGMTVAQRHFRPLFARFKG